MLPYCHVKSKGIRDSGQKVVRKKNIGFLWLCLFSNSIEINSSHGNCHITGKAQSKEDAVYLPISRMSFRTFKETFCLLTWRYIATWLSRKVSLLLYILLAATLATASWCCTLSFWSPPLWRFSLFCGQPGLPGEDTLSTGRVSQARYSPLTRRSGEILIDGLVTPKMLKTHGEC